MEDFAQMLVIVGVGVLSLVGLYLFGNLVRAIAAGITKAGKLAVDGGKRGVSGAKAVRGMKPRTWAIAWAVAVLALLMLVDAKVVFGFGSD